MTVSLRHNATSARTAHVLNRASRSVSTSLQKISSGNRIERIGDDATGAAVGVNLSAQARSGSQAIRNIQDGISMLDTSLAALDETGDLLSRLRELTVQSASDALGDGERAYIADEYQEINTEVRRLALSAEFNGQSIALGESYDVQVGIHGTKNDSISLPTANIKAIQKEIATLKLTTAKHSQQSLEKIDAALELVNQQQTGIGSRYNRLHNSMGHLEQHTLALHSSASRIEDTDMAMETTQMSLMQMRQSASTAAMGQAKGMSQAILALI